MKQRWYVAIVALALIRIEIYFQAHPEAKTNTLGLDAQRARVCVCVWKRCNGSKRAIRNVRIMAFLKLHQIGANSIVYVPSLWVTVLHSIYLSKANARISPCASASTYADDVPLCAQFRISGSFANRFAKHQTARKTHIMHTFKMNYRWPWNSSRCSFWR